jgi:hypothetical protein
LFPILRMKRVAIVPVPETDQPALGCNGFFATALLGPHPGFLPRLVWFLARRMF